MSTNRSGSFPTPQPLFSVYGLLHTALNASRDAIVITDADLDAPGPRYIYVNAAFEQMTGYPARDVIGRTPRVLQGPRSDRAVLAQLKENLSRGESFEGETFNYRKNGEEFLIQWRVEPMRDAHGKVTHFFSVQRDVTQERRLEAIATSINLAENIGYIFGGIRHELGNPVNSIKAALTVLREDLADERSPQVARVDRILGELRRVEYLLSNLRGFSAFDNPTLRATDIGAFLNRFVSLARSDCERDRVSLVLDAERGLRPCVADEQLLQSVLLNLLTNALDAVRGREESVITILARGAGNYVRISVVDNGPGMSPQALADAVKPFHTTKAKGSGLGLAIVQKLLASMHATFKMSSIAGLGTTATVELETAATTP